MHHNDISTKTMGKSPGCSLIKFVTSYTPTPDPSLVRPWSQIINQQSWAVLCALTSRTVYMVLSDFLFVHDFVCSCKSREVEVGRVTTSRPGRECTRATGGSKHAPPTRKVSRRATLNRCIPYAFDDQPRICLKRTREVSHPHNSFLPQS